MKLINCVIKIEDFVNKYIINYVILLLTTHIFMHLRNNNKIKKGIFTRRYLEKIIEISSISYKNIQLRVNCY